MRIDSYIAPLQRSTRIRSTTSDPTSAAKSRTTSNTDTITISEEARQATIASQLEQFAGLSPEAAEKLASGNVSIIEPDWDTYEVPSLQMNPEPMLYQKVWHDTASKEFDALEAQVKEYYEPMLSKMEGMSTNEAMLYLFETYKLPWLGDHFAEGTQLPDPPEGMSEQESDMAYNQLTSLFILSKPNVIRDPYALGAEGIARFDNITSLANETAQAAYDAAQKELDAKQEVWKAQQKEQLKQQIKNINATRSGTCLGFLSLSQENKQ